MTASPWLTLANKLNQTLSKSKFIHKISNRNTKTFTLPSINLLLNSHKPENTHKPGPPPSQNVREASQRNCNKKQNPNNNIRRVRRMKDGQHNTNNDNPVNNTNQNAKGEVFFIPSPGSEALTLPSHATSYLLELETPPTELFLYKSINDADDNALFNGDVEILRGKPPPAFPAAKTIDIAGINMQTNLRPLFWFNRWTKLESIIYGAARNASSDIDNEVVRDAIIRTVTNTEARHLWKISYLGSLQYGKLAAPGELGGGKTWVEMPLYPK